VTATNAGASAQVYDLDRLGWLQFEQLCSLVLAAEAGLTDLAWAGHADTARTASVEAPLPFAGRPAFATGAVTVCVLWVPDRLEPAFRRHDFARRLTRLADRGGLGPEDALVALTNLDAHDAHDAADAADAALVGTPLPRLVVLGAGELGHCIDRNPGVRAALPSVLGLRDLTSLIGAQASDRSSFDLDGARALARVFSPTRAFHRARAVLDRHRFAVLTGPPEMGKTAIARMIALAQLTVGWEAHETTRPDQIWAAFDPARRQVFIADDAFGSTEYHPDAADRWAHELARLLELLDDRHWLIWTSRPAPLKAGLRRVQRERGSERFPAPGEILVDAGDLETSERTLILFRHAKDLSAGRELRRLLLEAGPRIVEHPHFTPERIRRLCSERRDDLLALAAGDRHPLSWLELVERELTTPTVAMRTSFAALETDHRRLLVAMLDVPAGFVDERDHATTLRRHHPAGLAAHPTDLVDRLTDHFLRITPLGIGWVHPSWRDLVIDELRDNPADRQHFLAACGPHGAALALSQAGGAAGERTLPLLSTDADWDALTDRIGPLLRELDAPDVAALLLAIAGSLAADLPGRQRVEAESLAGHALGTARRVWFARGRAISLPLLDAWYAVDALVPTPAQPPVLETTWRALHPSPGPASGPGFGSRRGSVYRASPAPAVDRPTLVGADEWLALAQLLAARDPATLARLGFPARDAATLQNLIAAAEAAISTPDDELNALAESVLARIHSLAPDLAPQTRRAHAKLARDAAARRDRWWTPPDLDAPPSYDPAVHTPDHFDAADITRVLRDL
jgi:hypothetical protein